jgi:hypothetical protein
MQRKSADQRQTRRADRRKPLRQSVEMTGGKPHELDSGGVAAGRVRHNHRRKGAEIPRRRRRGPAHDRVRVRRELFEHGGEQRGPWDAAIARPQDAAQRLAPEPGAAALVGHRRPPAADTMAAPRELRPADGSGAHYENAAIAAAMRADAGRARVGRDRRLAEGMRMLLRLRERGGLAGARQGKACDNPCEVAGRQPRLTQASRRGLEHRGKALLQAETDIGRAGRRFAEQLSRHGLQARPTERGTAVDAEQECLGVHVRVMLPKPPRSKLPRETNRGCRYCH